jgi:REP element-mobilizing transposase RayT
MRQQVLFGALRNALGATARSWFRVVHFSVQKDHLYLIIEAEDQPSLARGMTGLSVRLARAYNSVLGRRGHLWSDRYHARALRTPREVRNALVYVLFNAKKHERAMGARSRSIDACSSGWWFDGWSRPPPSKPADFAGSAPVMSAQTWLAAVGWMHHGLIRFEERPK